MFELIKRDELNEIKVLWLSDSDILAVRNDRQKLIFVTSYGELTMPQNLEETHAVLNSANNGFIRADRDLVINSSKITEQNKEDGYVKLDGIDETFHVAAKKWVEIVK